MMSVYNNIAALSALEVKMSSTANNIANVETGEYKKTKATLVEGKSPGSVSVEISRDESADPIVYESYGETPVERELSNVDLVEAFAQSMITKRNFEANLKIFQSYDAMLGQVIDVFG